MTRPKTSCLSDKTGKRSSKRALFALAVVACLVFSGVEVFARGIDRATGLLETILYVTGGAYVGGRFAESSETKPPGNQ